MTRRLLCGRKAVAILLLAFVVTSASAETSPAGVTAEDFLAWIGMRRGDVGIAAYSPAAPEAGVFHNADAVFPLASVRKVLVLGAYADAVASRALDPAEEVPLAAVESWYWPETDGNTHRKAVEDLRRSGRIRNAPAGPTLQLDDVAFAAIRWSDNAAADYLFERVGTEAVERFALRHRLVHQEPIAPTLGDLIVWTTSDPVVWAELTPAARAAKSWEAARATRGGRLGSRPFPGYSGLRAFAHRSSGGTAREWAGLIAAAFTAEDPAAVIVRRHLEWPLAAHPELKGRFEHLGAKPGAVAGVRTELVYIEPRGEPPMAAALFLRHLDASADAGLARSFLDQRFLIRMATSPAFFERVRDAFR